MKKSILGIIIFIMSALFLIGVICFLTTDQYREYTKCNNGSENSGIMFFHSSYSGSHHKQFTLDENKTLTFNVWWQGLSGDVEFKVSDDKGNVYIRRKANHIKEKFQFPFKEGNYYIDVYCSDFTGAASLSYKKVNKEIGSRK